LTKKGSVSSRVRRDPLLNVNLLREGTLPLEKQDSRFQMEKKGSGEKKKKGESLSQRGRGGAELGRTVREREFHHGGGGGPFRRNRTTE